MRVYAPAVHRLPATVLCFAVGACTPPAADETAADTGPGSPGETDTPIDTAHTGDSGEELGILPPEGHPASGWFSVPPDRGLTWERDRSFGIEEFTVPQMVVMADGTLRMYATNMAEPSARWVMESVDGLTWGTPSEALRPEAFAPLDCGDRIEDIAPLYRPSGLDLVAEGSSNPDHTQPAVWRKFCRLNNADPGPAVPDTAAYFYEGEASDNQQISVPATVALPDWSALLYFVGNQTQSDEGIRVVSLSTDGALSARLGTVPLLDRTCVDPLPIYLEGGGIRLFHTHGHGGGPGFADSVDGISFSGDSALIPHEGEDCMTTGGECLLDPAFLRLPDDRLVLYFTRLERQERGTFTARIERAFATD